MPTIHAVSAILIDADSGQVLYEHNADAQRPMASTTKIMTALVFCEHVPDEKSVVTASKYASTISESSLHLKPGEKLTAHDMLRAILMRSANDACVAAAEHVAGNVASFAEMMNQKAKALGCKHTHFVNPNGLNDKQHYTCARDLALIARAAIQCPRIDEVVRLKSCRIARSIDKQDLTLRNHSIRFLKDYTGADGIKTGWTVPAGHCFVGSATRKGVRLIAVVLKSPDFVHETAQLMDFGFANYVPKTILDANTKVGDCGVQGGNVPSIPVKLERPLVALLPKSARLAEGEIKTTLKIHRLMAPIAPGTVVGEAVATWNGYLLATRPIVTLAGAEAHPRPTIKARVSTAGKSLAGVASIFLVAVVSFTYYAKQQRQKAGENLRARPSTLTKSARCIWRRIKKSLRSADRRRTR